MTRLFRPVVKLCFFDLEIQSLNAESEIGVNVFKKSEERCYAALIIGCLVAFDLSVFKFKLSKG